MNRNHIRAVSLALLLTLAGPAAVVSLSTPAAAEDTSEGPADGVEVTTADDEFANGSKTNTSAGPSVTRNERVTLSQSGILNGDYREKFWVVKDGSDKYYGYVTHDTASNTNDDQNLHLYTSSNGKNWSNYSSNPVLDDSQDLDDPTVVKKDGTWYLYAENRETQDAIRIYTSSDGKDWTYQTNFTNKYGPQSPVVKIVDGTWYMFYERFDNASESKYTVRYATSSDGKSWTDQGTLFDPPDSDNIVIDDLYQGSDGKWYLYYHDNAETITNYGPEEVATADTMLGTYNTTGDLFAYDSAVDRQSATVIHNESGQYVGPRNGKVWVYGWDMGASNVGGTIGLYKSKSYGGLKLDTLEEDGDVAEWTADAQVSSQSAVTSPVIAGTYSREVTSDGTDSSYARTNKSFSSTLAPDDTVWWVKVPQPANADSWPYKRHFYAGSTKIASIGFDTGVKADNNDISAYNPDGTWTQVGNVTYGQYTKVRIDWEWGSNQYDLYINGELAVANDALVNSASGYDLLSDSYDYNASTTGMTIQTDGTTPHYSQTNGSYKSEWHDFGSTADFGQFLTSSATNGQSLSWEFRSSSDGTASNASSWYSDINNVPDNRYIQVRATFSGTSSASPMVQYYTVRTASGKTISGTVLNMNGQGIANATVMAWTASTDVANPKEELQTLANRTPSAFDPNKSLVGDGGLFKEANTQYVAVTTGDVAKDGWFQSADLRTPQVQVPSGEVVLSVWDPTQDPFIEGEYDEELPGVNVNSDNGKVVVKEIGPEGSVIGNPQTYELTETKSGEAFFTGEQFDYAKVPMDAGFYRVHPKGHPETAYVIKVGNPVQAFLSNVTTPDGTLANASQIAQDKLAKAGYDRLYAQTDASGNFEFTSIPSNAEVVALQPMKAGGLLNSSSTPTLALMRDQVTSANYNGSIIVSAKPEYVKPPESGVTLRAVELKRPPMYGLGAFQNFTDMFEDFLANQSFSGLSDALQQRLNSTDKSTLVDTYNQLLGVVGGSDRLTKLAKDNLPAGESELVFTSPDDVSKTKLATRIDAMQQALTEHSATTKVQKSSGSITNQTDGPALIDRKWVISGEIPSVKRVQVTAHFINGSSRPVPDKYVSVEQSFNTGIKDQQETAVYLRDYPLPKDAAAGVYFEMSATTKNGRVAHAQSKTVKNPAFDGEIPSMKNIDLSTLTPGPNEQVKMTLTPTEDTSMKDLTDVTVYGPSGSAVQSSITGARTATFQTSGKGVYNVRAKFQTTSGKNMTLTYSVRAADTDYAMPASVRAKNTPFGTVAMTGAKLSGGDVDVRDGGKKAVITAELADGANPDSVHVYTTGVSLAPDRTVEVRVVNGSSTVKRHFRVTEHLSRLGGDALVYRQSEAWPRDEKTPYGSISTNGSVTIAKTYTTGDGDLSVRVLSSPGIIEEARWYVDSQWPDNSTQSFLSVATPRSDS